MQCNSKFLGVSKLLALAGTAAVCAASSGALAQAFPSKPIRLLSMATGVADGLSRMMAQKMQESLGQAVIIEPQPGAGGAIAADQVARSAPDGHTLFVTYPDPLVLRHLLVKNIPYDTLRDFTPVTMMIEAVIVFAVNPSVPAANLRGLIDHIKANPGKLTYGSNGIGTSFQMAVEALKQHTGANVIHVPFKNSPEAMAALLRGDIQLLPAALGTAMPIYKTGKLKLLAVVNDARAAALPDLPSTREVVSGFQSPPYWTGVVGPAGLPQPVLRRLHAEMAKAMTSAELRKRAAEISFTVVANSPEEFRRRIASEIDASARTAKAAGIKPE